MIGPGKCPSCGKSVTAATIHGIDVGAPFGTTWKGITYNCNSCNAVLGVQIDPIAIKTDIVKDLLAALRK
jgi:hypothetical protein